MLNDLSRVEKTVKLALMLSGDDAAVLTFDTGDGTAARQVYSFPDTELSAAFLELDALAPGDCDMPDLGDGAPGPEHALQRALQCGLRSLRKVRRDATGPAGKVACMLATLSRQARAPAPGILEGLGFLVDFLLAEAARGAAPAPPPPRPQAGDAGLATPSPGGAEDGRFRLLFEHMPGLYVVLTPDRFEIVLVSNAYLRATKVTREEILGRNLFDVFPDDPSDTAATGVRALSTSLARVRDTGLPDVMAVQRYPIPRPAAEGGGFEVRYWSPINSPICDAGGRIIFIIHRVEDVTDYVLSQSDAGSGRDVRDMARLEAEVVLRSLDLKRLADSLAQSEQRLRYVTRATNDVVWDWTLADNTLWCSHSAIEPLGSALAGCTTLRHWEMHICPADRARVLEGLREAVASGCETWAAEYALALGAGERCVLHRCFLVTDSLGQPLRMVGSIADITEQKRQESQVRMQAEMLDNATDAILVRDLDNRILYWNHAATQRYGWSSEQVLGTQVAQTLYACCSTRQFECAMDTLMQQGDFSGRLPHATREGRVLTMHAHWILVRHEDGSPRAILSVITDLSERIDLEQRLLQMEKLEALGRLTGGIAHDFNNWLTVIIGNAEELADALADHEELGENARMIQLAGERGAQLTRRLLAFARRQPLSPEVIVVGEVIEALRPLIARSLTESIHLRLIDTGAPWRTHVDRGQLEAAILNMCINARDAMPGCGRVTIRLMLVTIGADEAGEVDLEAGEYVTIVIADSGQGIPREVIDRVFEPFFTTKSESSGSGLGLSMVYGFAKQSRGDVTIHSEYGRGTVVRLYLPLSWTPLPSAVAVGAEPRSLRGCSVLLVEDDAIVRQHVLGQLHELGCEVTAVADAGQALAHLARGVRIDVLFSDIVMPGMSGIELARRARAARPGLQVLLSSGYAFEALHDLEQLDPAVRLLNKPYGKATLARTLAEVIDDTGDKT